MQCVCGCGAEFEPSRTTLWKMKRGEDAGYLPGHNCPKREKSPHWKGGRYFSTGYVYIYRPDHIGARPNGYVAEHRMVMIDHLGRNLDRGEVAHHLNGVRDDNRIENLVLMTNSAHDSHHRSGPGNPNWMGGRRPITCRTCGTEFLPAHKGNDNRARYCSRSCSSNRHHPVTP